jgi:copper chaperone CopZ/NAD-dependent dihydropyrimidine dehydrogenase PreA subunit
VTKRGGGVESLQMPIDGMSCPSCAMGLEEALREAAGVVRAEVSYEGATAIVVYDSGVVSVDGLRDAVRRAGFSAAGEHEYQTISTRSGRTWVQAFIDRVDFERCTGCGRCVQACGQDVYALVEVGGNRKATVVNGDNCLGDCHCHKACHFGALVCKPQRLVARR